MTLHTASPADFTQQVLVPLAEWSSIWPYAEGDYTISGGSVWLAVDPVLGVTPASTAWTEVVGGGGGGLPTGLTFVSPCLTIGDDTDNQLVGCGSATGDPVSVTAVGSDTDIPLKLGGKGAGGLQLGPDYSGPTGALDYTNFALDPTVGIDTGLYILMDTVASYGAPVTGAYIVAEMNNAAATISALNGLSVTASATGATGSQPGVVTGFVQGIYTELIIGGTPTLVVGNDLDLFLKDTGVIPAFYGYRVNNMDTEPGSTVTELAAFKMNPSTIDPASTVTTAYGMQLGHVTGAATNYAIHTGLGVVRFGDVVEMPEIADPAAPAATTSRLYTRDNGAGKTQLVVRFPTGAVQVLATEP